MLTLLLACFNDASPPAPPPRFTELSVDYTANAYVSLHLIRDNADGRCFLTSYNFGFYGPVPCETPQ